MARLQSFSLDADPLVKELVPVADQLTPTLRSVDTLSPYLRHLFVQLNPLISVSETGLPAIRDVLNGATPLLGSLGPFLEQLNPILSWLSLHQQLTSDFISQGASALAATTTSFGGNGLGHYLRQFSPIGPETLSLAPSRDAANRGNTYPPPLWLGDPQDFNAGGKFPGSFIFPAWDCNNTGAGGDGSVPAASGHPACWVPSPPAALLGESGKFPQVNAASYPTK